MTTKEEILQEIRRTAGENGGIPLGNSRFQKETGIKPYDWQKYWARFGDAQKEAGFTPNTLQQSYNDEFVINCIIDIIRKLNKFPTYNELRFEKRNNPSIPQPRVFFESKIQKQNLALRIIAFCSNKSDYQDIVKVCKTTTEEDLSLSKETSVNNNIGEVYLFKSGRYYKIGRTNDTVRRGSEIRIQLPEEMTLIHSIKTDDPSGIENYWHRRFEAKRKNGEWFDLSTSDVKAFRMWRKIA